MIKRILSLLAVVSVFAFCASDAFAQMTDDALITYVMEAMSSGKSQAEVAKELAAKGVSVDQITRLKSMYDKGGAELPGGSKTAKAMSDRTRKVDFKLLEKEFFALDSLATVEKEKEVFGRSIFTNHNLSFAPNVNIPTPANYKLGPGDEVIIDIWGSNEATIRQTISPDGFINVPNLGLISLNGMTVKNADSYLRKKFGKIYPVDGENPESDIKLTLGNIRSIQVNILGEVAVPGTYSLSSLSTIYNALYCAGGVSDVGTLREIRLVRNKKTIATVDVYDFILNGNSSDDVKLQDGDVIIVAPYKQLVDVAGKVKRPMVYEMKEGETVQNLIDYSGGFAGDAYKSNLRLIRRNGVEYQVYTVDSEDFGAFTLMDGDSLTVETMLDRYANKIDIQGAVYRPGAYQLGGNITTVSQLIRKADGLKGDAFTNRAILYREKEDLTRQIIPVDIKALLSGSAEDILLQKNDSLYVSSIHELQDIGLVSLEGEVANPGEYPYAENMTLEDLILQAGGLLESASTVRIDVSRRIKNPDSTTQLDSIGQVFTFALKDGYAIDGELLFSLQPYDQVFVRRSPGYFEQTHVTISGEVIFPGNYVLTHKTERISDLVKKAGGVNSWAYVKGARLQRKMNEDEKRRVESTLEVLDSAKDSINVENLDLAEYYYVGIDLEQALAKPGSDMDLVLREGDQLFVPEYINTVKISGNVMYPNTVTYNPEYLVSDYVEMAGGYGYHSKKSKAYIIYMNGNVTRARKFSKDVIEPGCEIVIPQKRQRDSKLSEIMSIATTSSSLATMFATLGNIIMSMKP